MVDLKGIKLTKNEYRALSDLIAYSNKCCAAGCIWEECDEKIRSFKRENDAENYCFRCSFTKAVEGLENKFWGLDE